jgi:hypothetical protein
MKLSKSKLISLAALGLAVAALLVDRLALGPDGAPPKSAEAATAARPAATSTPSATPASAAAPAAPGAAPVRLADRLKALAAAPNLDPLHARDAFMPPESWLAQSRAPETAASAPAADPAEKFIREHKLTSVLMAGDGGIAMVNSKALRVGQEVDGFKLVRLEPGSAVFRGGDDAEVKLKTVVEPR